MCREEIAPYVTVWHRDPDHNYIWLLLMSADKSEATFIGGMYFPPDNADAYAYKSVQTSNMMRPISADISRMYQEHKNVNVLIFADLNAQVEARQIELSCSDIEQIQRVGDITRKSADDSRVTRRDLNVLRVCQENQLVIMNGLDRFPGTEQCTFTSKNTVEPDKVVRTMLGYGLCHADTLHKVCIFRLHTIGPISDHKVLQCVARIPD